MGIEKGESGRVGDGNIYWTVIETEVFFSEVF